MKTVTARCCVVPAATRRHPGLSDRPGRVSCFLTTGLPPAGCLPVSLPPPPLAGHFRRGSLPPVLPAWAGQTGDSRDGQLNFEVARRRALENRSDGVRTSTSPQCGASSAATSLTPTRPTAFLRQRPSGAAGAGSCTSTCRGSPGQALTRPRVGSRPPPRERLQAGAGNLRRGFSCRHPGGLQAMRYPFLYRLNRLVVNRWTP
jgi:hypothetical protein